MQTPGTSDQSTRFPVVSGATGYAIVFLYLFMAWIGELFHRAESGEKES